VRRSSSLLILGATTAAFILPVSAAAAATTVSYNLEGSASASLFPSVSLAGTATSVSRTERGAWTAVFQQDLGAILPGGTFTFTSKVRTFQDAIAGGTFGQPFGSPSGTCAKTTIPVHANLSGGGYFDVTLTRYGSLRTGSCVVQRTTVVGKATLVFP
jgi:hypothetical protein